MLSLLSRNLLFILLQPGIVTGLIPFLLVRHHLPITLSPPFNFLHYLGIAAIAVGVLIVFHCVTTFAVEGRGTLSPADPTKQLATSGLYKFSRNPMYHGVMLILIGEFTFTQSPYLLIYSGVVFAAFHLFILFVEEPRLRRDFEKEYDQYQQRVRRWI